MQLKKKKEIKRIIVLKKNKPTHPHFSFQNEKKKMGERIPKTKN
jgi:hypothetical protein